MFNRHMPVFIINASTRNQLKEFKKKQIDGE